MDKILLGDLCLPASKNIKLASTDLIDYVDISSVDNQAKFITGYTTYEYQDAPSRARKSVSIGDVIISTVRPNLNAVAVFDITTPNTPVISTGFCVLSCRDDVNPRYVYYACQSREFIRQLVSQATGASYPAVNDKIIRNALIPNYTLSSQNFICDQLDSVQNLINIKKKENKIFNETIKARFVEMFGDEKNLMTMSEVCSIITDGTHQPPFVEMFGDEKNLMTMSEVCSIITDGTHQPPRFTDTGIPFIFVSNITGDKVTYDAEKFIDQDTYDELIKRTPIEVGDVLLSTVGSYGHPAVVRSDKKFLFQRHIAYLKPRREIINSDYLHGAILSPDAQRQIEEGVKGIAQKTLNLSEIKKMRIPVPVMNRQKEFAAFVAQVDKSKSVNDRIIDRLQRTKASLMQEYFG